MRGNKDRIPLINSWTRSRTVACTLPREIVTFYMPATVVPSHTEPYSWGDFYLYNSSHFHHELGQHVSFGQLGFQITNCLWFCPKSIESTLFPIELTVILFHCADLLIRKMKGLQEILPLSITHPVMSDDGKGFWYFKGEIEGTDKADPVYGYKWLKQVWYHNDNLYCTRTISVAERMYTIEFKRLTLWIVHCNWKSMTSHYDVITRCRSTTRRTQRETIRENSLFLYFSTEYSKELSAIIVYIFWR